VRSPPPGLSDELSKPNDLMSASTTLGVAALVSAETVTWLVALVAPIVPTTALPFAVSWIAPPTITKRAPVSDMRSPVTRPAVMFRSMLPPE
jgi:hypothetical protein